MHLLLEFIEENLECSLSLAALAAVVDLRPLYFARAFKTALGRSPHQYVLGRRIERSQELLRTTEMTVPYLDQFVRGSNGYSAVDRVKLMKLMWDAIGTEFGGRHEL